MISIGLPTYKSKFLEHAIQSVLNQTYKDFELIIVNDASPEDIRSIVNKFNDSRIRYYENEKNIGRKNLVENWNKTLNYAKGEYFVLFSDDDIYEPTFLEEIHKLFIKYPNVDIAHCKVRIIDENNNTIDFTPSCPEYENIIDFIWHRLKGFRYQYAPDFMVRTEKLRAIGGFVDFPLAWGSDDATWFKVAKDNGIAYLNKPLCCWRKSEYNISNNGSLELRIRANIFYSEWLRNFIKDLVINDEEYKFKIIQTNKLINKWKTNNIVNLLINTTDNGFLSPIKILYKWTKYRIKYKLEISIFIKACLIKFKTLLFKT